MKLLKKKNLLKSRKKKKNKSRNKPLNRMIYNGQKAEKEKAQFAEI